MFLFFRKEIHQKAFAIMLKYSKSWVKELDTSEGLRHRIQNKKYSELEALMLFYVLTLSCFSNKNIPTDQGHKLYYLLREKFNTNDVNRKLEEEGFVDGVIKNKPGTSPGPCSHIDDFCETRFTLYYEEVHVLLADKNRSQDLFNTDGPIYKFYYCIKWQPLTNNFPWDTNRIFSESRKPLSQRSFSNINPAFVTELLPLAVSIFNIIPAFVRDIDAII